jgi:hypothetical protein
LHRLIYTALSLVSETFIFYIKKLKALNAKDKAEYHDFALKCLKDYIVNNPSWIQTPSSYTAYHIDAFLEYLYA